MTINNTSNRPFTGDGATVFKVVGIAETVQALVFVANPGR
jgi:hypothetical protein